VLKGLSPILAAIIALLGAWFVTLRLSAQWEARKKRAELDIMLARDFYKLVASFKAIAREAGALGSRPQMSPQDWDARHNALLAANATMLGPRPQTSPESWDARHAELIAANAASLGLRPRQAPDEWDQWHLDLLRRAITAESDMEAILLALISEGSVDEGVTHEQRQQRLRASGLLRVAFRSLREQIEHRELRQPGFHDPLFWLMNRVQGDLSRMVFARAVRKLRKLKSSSLRSNAADYLKLIAYRTIDLEMSAWRLSAEVAEFLRRRDESRYREREINLRKVFKDSSFAATRSLTSLPALGSASILVFIYDGKAFPADLDRSSTGLLAVHPALTHVLFVGDHLDTGPSPGSEQTEIHAVYVKPRGGDRVICKPEEELPVDLPYKSPAELHGIPSWLPEVAQQWLIRRWGSPGTARGVSLLAWNLDSDATDWLNRIADTEI
jgi:hypothetical protein